MEDEGECVESSDTRDGSGLGLPQIGNGPRDERVGEDGPLAGIEELNEMVRDRLAGEESNSTGREVDESSEGASRWASLEAEADGAAFRPAKTRN